MSDLHTAKQMYAQNVQFTAPCAFGIDCKLHFRPTLREKTNGRWLHEGDADPVSVSELPSTASKQLAIKTYEDSDAFYGNSLGSNNKPSARADYVDYHLPPHRHLPTNNAVKVFTATKQVSTAETQPDSAVLKLQESEAALRSKIGRLEAKYATMH